MNGAATFFMCGKRGVRELLHHLEYVATLFALIFVERHIGLFQTFGPFLDNRMRRINIRGF